MLGYLLLAISVSAFGGLLFFTITGERTGVGIMVLVASIIGGVIWQVKRNKAKK